MKFFKPEDFNDSIYTNAQGPQICANLANAKLEREGKVVYYDITYDMWGDNFDPKGFTRSLLIGRETKIPCNHPKKKVKLSTIWTIKNHVQDEPMEEYQCECGAKVQPKEFEEVKNV